MEIATIIENQRDYFRSGITMSYQHRISALKNLKEAILYYEDDIYKALKDDLNKSHMETYLTEINMVLSEIKLMKKKLKKWMKPHKVSAGLLNFPSKAFIKPDPYGVVLIISPWNYPFQLLFSPLVGAIAAGNCVIMKPSEISQNTTNVSIKIIERAFNSEYITIFPGGVDVTTALLNIKTDYIFFTGSAMVGKIIAKAAAQFLTPYTLELGGKSPCILDSTCDLEISVKRVVWGKLLNGGQTCVAPDYVYVERNIKEKFIELFIKYSREFYGENPTSSDHYCKVINENHYNRLKSLLNQGELRYGGSTDDKNLKIHPALLENCPEDSQIMTDEIFGPICPIVTFENIMEVTGYIEKKGKPLALYIFSNSRANVDYILHHTTSGGVSINDTISHLVSHKLPFGGVGESGNGAYHGEESFRAFSHLKSVLHKGKFDPPIKFPPYKNEKKVISLLKKWL